MPTVTLSLTKVLLGPVLLYQGRRTRQETLVLPEPPGERIGQLGSGKPLRILLAGDSSAVGVGTDHQQRALLGRMVNDLKAHFELSFQLIGQSGIDTPEMISLLNEHEAGTFDVVVTSLGVNDVTSQSNVSEWLTRQKELRAIFRQRFGARHIIVSGLPPMAWFPALPQPLRWFLGRQAAVFDERHRDSLLVEKDASFVPLNFFSPGDGMARDGFHPSEAVYQAWATRLCQEIRAHVGL